jgi:arginase
MRAGAPALTVRDKLSLLGGEHRAMWLHIDLDVIDRRVMPAVDSHGSPGLTFAQLAQLAELIGGLVAARRVIGADVAIFDPELDPHGNFVRSVVAYLARGFATLRGTT